MKVISKYLLIYIFFFIFNFNENSVCLVFTFVGSVATSGSLATCGFATGFVAGYFPAAFLLAARIIEQ